MSWNVCLWVFRNLTQIMSHIIVHISIAPAYQFYQSFTLDRLIYRQSYRPMPLPILQQQKRHWEQWHINDM